MIHNITMTHAVAYFAAGQALFIADYFYTTVIKGATRNVYFNDEITAGYAALIFGIVWPLFVIYILSLVPKYIFYKILDKIDYIADKKHKRLNPNIVNTFKV